MANKDDTATGGTKRDDPERIRAIAAKLEQAVDLIDTIDAGKPRHVDAGIYRPLLSDLVSSVVADVAELQLRLGKAAESAREAAVVYERTGEQGVEALGGLINAIDEMHFRTPGENGP